MISRFEDFYLTDSANGLTRPSAVRGEGYPMIGMGELFQYDILEDVEMDLVQMNTKELKKFLVLPNDLLFARQSLVAEGAGKCSIVGEIKNKTTFESHIIRVRLDPSKCNPWYFYYLFKLSYNPIKTIVSQCAQAGIRGSELARLKIDVPDFMTQNKIGNFLKSFDDLILTNKKRISALESLAKELFKETFIRPKFKGNFIYEKDAFELAGWRYVKFGELVRQIKISLKEWQGLPLVDLSHMESFSIAMNEYGDASDLTTNIKKVSKGDLIFGSIRPYQGKAGFSPVDGAIAGTVFNFRPLDERFYYYLLMLISHPDFIQFAVNYSNGTKMPVVDFDDLCRFRCFIPESISVFDNFNDLVKPMIDQIQLLIETNIKLKELRDKLLNRIMSGELKV